CTADCRAVVCAPGDARCGGADAGADDAPTRAQPVTSYEVRREGGCALSDSGRGPHDLAPLALLGVWLRRRAGRVRGQRCART
ncbi:MAG: hypothetical protein ABW252_23630, partial [Polyangiales bacterium]